MKTKRWKYKLYIVLAFFPFINVLGSNNISIPLYTVKSGDIHVDGAIDALKRKRSFTPSFCRGSNYKKAHKKATPQANLQYYEVDNNGNRTRDKKNAVGQKIFVTDGIRTSTVIDRNYAEDGKIE